MDEPLKAIDQVSTTAIDLAMRFGPRVLVAILILVAGYFAGLTIIFTRPYRVGDFISIQKEEGEVLDVSLFSTVLGHPDLSRVVIPNRKIVGEILHNYGKLRQLEVEVGVAYSADVGAALRAVEETLRANPRVLQDPKPVIGVAQLAASQVAIAVKPWVNVSDYAPATAEVNQAILDAFRSRSIAFPVPQREVRMLPA
jgi:small conductance mechanosensitive channel